jgi:hypothetical protein
MSGLDAWNNPRAIAAREANDCRPLVCGHSPSAHCEISTGTAHTRDGREICFDCADKEQRDEMRTAEHYSGYLQDREIHTWSGGLLARVTSRVTRRVGFYGSSRVYFAAIDLNGKRWYGNSPGDGMYCRLHATRSLPQPKRAKGV